MARILYFAWMRERMGRSDEALTLPSGVETVGGLVALLQQRDAAGAAAFAHPAMVRSAVNQEFATPGTPLQDGDEVAFFPPVTGG